MYCSRRPAPGHQHRQQPRVLPADGAPAGGRHDRGERPDPLRAVHRERLRDHAAHRDAHDVCGVVAEVVEDRDAVVGHVGEVVRRGCGPADERPRQPGPGHPPGDAAGTTRVAVVEADHVEPLLGQQRAEPRVPPRHRAAEAHDQQHRGVGGLAEGLVADVQVALPAGDRHEPLVGHGDRGAGAGLVELGHATSLPSLDSAAARRFTFQLSLMWLPSHLWSHRSRRSSARPATPGLVGCGRSRARAARSPRPPASSGAARVSGSPAGSRRTPRGAPSPATTPSCWSRGSSRATARSL